MEIVNVFDYERLAEARMAPSDWAYYHSGADDEVTLRANRAAFARLWLRPRFLRDMERIAMATEVLGTPVSMPILVAPTALHGLAHPDGECATASAVGAMGTLMIASDSASRALEDVAAAATGPLWYQLYTSDRETTAERVQRATDAGFRAIVLTVDAPRWGRKEAAIRLDFDQQPHLNYGNYTSLAVKRAILPLTWETFAWLRSLTPLPYLMKGILTAEDAALAVTHGAAGIVVSNHGGRQLDTAVPSLVALPEVVEAVNGAIPVYFDGGIRRGTDVLKALALGARAVLIGRPILWGLAAAGPEGVRGVLKLLRDEFEQAMALAGCASLAEITPALLRQGW
jgi:4-hydroxymandelate oxidase